MKSVYHMISCLLWIPLCCILLTGCQTKPDKKLGDGILDLQIETNVQSMDPHKAIDGTSFEVIACITDGLTQPDSTGHAAPAIAESWSVSADQKVWTFHLRDNALWSKTGSRVTAHDFVYAWQRAVTPATGSAYAYMLSEIAHITNAADIIAGKKEPQTLGVEALDDYTFVVYLDTPVSYFADLLYLPIFYPMEQSFVESHGSNYATSCETLQSNGAFRMKTYARSSLQFSLIKNDTYWDADRIHLNQINYYLIHDPIEAYNAYRSGRLDYMILSGDQIPAFSHETDFHTFDTGYLWYLSLNMQDVPALKNLNLRLALSSAIDRETMVTQILQDGSTASYFLISDYILNQTDSLSIRTANEDCAPLIAYNISKAQSYLEEAKRELGVDSFEFDLLVTPAQANTVAVYLQQQIEQTLPDVKINIVSKVTRQAAQSLQNGDYQIALTRWGADYADPGTYLNILRSNNSTNYGKWSNAEFDALLKEASLSANTAFRLHLLQQAEAIAIKDLAVIPLYEKKNAVLTKDNISGITHHAIGLGNIYKDTIIFASP